jgi:hypothetical protein
MTTVETVAAPARSARADRGSLRAERLFYVIAAYTMLVLTAVGFQNFYLRGRGALGEMTGQIVPLIVAHGLAMSSWIVLFCVQSTLILVGNRRLHMVIGPLGGALAAAIVILGTAVATLSVRLSPAAYAPIGGARFFLVIMLSEMVLFGAFVTVALVNRHRAEIHRPMMLLATIAILSGSLARIPALGSFAAMPPLYAYGPALAFGGLLFVLHWAMTGLANRWYLIGYAALMLASFVSVGVGNTTLWNDMVGALVP